MVVFTGVGSPKRHIDDDESDSDDAAMETDGPPSRKEIRLEQDLRHVSLCQKSCGQLIPVSDNQEMEPMETDDLLFRSQEGRPPGENSANNENPLVGVYPPYHRSFRDDESEEDPEGDEVMPTQKVDSQAKFQVSDLTKLKRQLILGAPSCCVRFRSSRNDPMTSGFDWSLVDKVIKDGKGMEVVEVLKDVSLKGRTSSQDGVMITLALCIRSQDIKTKTAAFAAMQEICTTPTLLFQLINYIEIISKKTKSTGWGRGLRRAVCKWYNSHALNPVHLAMHVTKYGSRCHWSHRDLFRLSHIKPVNDAIGFIVRYLVKGFQEAQRLCPDTRYRGQEQLQEVQRYLKAVDEARMCEDVQRTIELIREHRLVREHLRTEMLNSAEVWGVMLPDMPLTAMLRNLAKMTTLGLFDDPANISLVRAKLTNVEALKKARVHPLKILTALRTYLRGKGERGKLVWEPNDEVAEVLNMAFYQSFTAVEPTGKKFLIAVDISSSMAAAFHNSSMSCREAATCVAMVTARTETNCDVVGFHTDLIELPQFKEESKTLQQLVTETQHLGFGATDCSRPMTYACERNKDFDVFMVLTDNETNSHRLPPWQALQEYREAMNKPTAKLIVVAMTAHDFSIARPDDVYMLDVVGFDPELPEVIREFVMGHLE